MLNFYMGATGSGKTTLLLQRAAKAVAAGRRVIFIVPEQFSFETEKALFAALGEQAALHAEVLSFTRLCNRIFREYGGLAGEYIGSGARLLLMSLALGELRGTLEYYTANMHSTGFVEALVAQVSEFKNAGLTPERLAQAAPAPQAGALPDPLGGKLRELSEIFTVYQAMVARSYRDAEDDIVRACGYLECEDFFGGYDVFIDAFKDFTAGELMLLEHIIAHAPSVTVALCTDSPEERESGLGLFSPVRRTAARLAYIAKESGVPVEEPVLLLQNHRAKHPELVHLEQNLYRLQPLQYRGEGGAVTLVRAPNQYAEVEYIAATICELVRTRGLRYREIAVVGRELSAYSHAVESVFTRYELPYFMDARTDISEKPLAAALLYAVEAIKPRTGLDTDSVLALLKTSLLLAGRTEIGELENYCFVWDIAGAAWAKPFTAAPSGYEGPRTGDDALLARLEALRRRVALPLLELQAAVRDCTGEEYARAVFRYLERSGILEALRAGARAEENYEAAREELHAEMVKKRKALEEKYPYQGGLDGGAPATETRPLSREYFDRLVQLEETKATTLPPGALQECAQLYDAVVDILDQFATALREARLSPQRFGELLRLALLALDIGELPRTLDQVIVGTSDRVRLDAPRVVFLLGANEGVFPMAPKAGGLFTDAERDRMNALGLELADTAESRSLGETYYAYMAACSASEALYICHSRANLRGRTLYPSSLVKGALAALPLVAAVDTECSDRAMFVQNNKTAFDEFCRAIRSDNEFTAALREHLCAVGEGERVERLLHPRDPAALRLTDGGVISALYGKRLAVSPSKLDRFHQCKMAYFCRYALGIRPRRKAELSPLESGSVIHFVLQGLLSRFTPDELAQLSDEALEQELTVLLTRYIEESMGGAGDKSARFFYLFSRLKDTLHRLVRHLAREFAVSDFRPVYFELPIKKGGTPQGGPFVEPVELTLENGATVFVEGVADRVDLMEKGDARYLRVVDYKTGAKEFNLTDVYYGLGVQMLVYLFTIRRMGQGGLAGTVPAGVLYMPAKTQYQNLERGAGADEAAKKQDDALRMNGLLLRNLEALSGMERGCSGTFLPVTLKVKDNGDGTAQTDIKGPVATLEEFGKLERHVYGLVAGMARALYAGDIAAVPTYTKNSGNTCEYCDYRGVCGRGEDGARFEPPDMKNEEIFALLEDE